VPVGTVIARIDAGGAAAAPNPPAEAKAPATPAAAPAPVNAPANAAANTPTGGNRFYSPLVLNIAAKEGIGMTELEAIPGTGNEGRVTKKDILNYVANRGAAPAPAVATPPAQQAAVVHQPQAPQNHGANVEIIEMDRMRKMIADHMVRSKATSPHVTSFTECDVTNIVKWREKNKKAFENKYGEKITYTPIFVEAVVNCIKQF